MDAAAATANPLKAKMVEGEGDVKVHRIRITLTGGSPEIPGWLHAPRINLEAFADTKPQAFDLLVAAREAAEQLTNTRRDGIVVSSCEQETGLSWSPDPFTETPRYLAAIVMYVHPDPAAGFGNSPFGTDPFGE